MIIKRRHNSDYQMRNLESGYDSVLAVLRLIWIVYRVGDWTSSVNEVREGENMRR